MVPALTKLFQKRDVFLLETVYFKPDTFRSIIYVEYQDTPCQGRSIAVKRHFGPTAGGFCGIDMQNKLLCVLVSSLKAAQQKVIGSLARKFFEFLLQEEWMVSGHVVSMIRDGICL